MSLRLLDSQRTSFNLKQKGVWRRLAFLIFYNKICGEDGSYTCFSNITDSDKTSTEYRTSLHAHSWLKEEVNLPNMNRAVLKCTYCTQPISICIGTNITDTLIHMNVVFKAVPTYAEMNECEINGSSYVLVAGHYTASQ